MRAWVWAAAVCVVLASCATVQASEPGWISDARTGCRVWNEAPQPKETITWSGACRNGLAQGRGVLQWFEDGKPGARYEGEWRDGKMMNGQVVLTLANGRYEGDLVDGKFNGYGVYTWPNGSRYEGEWRDSKPNGVGRFTDQNGEVANGVWLDGCFKDGDRQAALARDLSTCP